MKNVVAEFLNGLINISMISQHKIWFQTERPGRK